MKTKHIVALVAVAAVVYWLYKAQKSAQELAAAKELATREAAGR